MISEYLDLGNGRYKDNEVDTLHELVTNREKYNGQTKTVKHRFDSWASDGKFTREEETTYTFRGNDEGVCIEEKYQYYYDDGQSGTSDRVYNTGRGILNLLKSIFGD